MWNHAPDMRRRGGTISRLNDREMPDLVAYLFSQRYFQRQGDPSKGRRLYEEKGCAQCHERRRGEVRAPDLSESTEVYSPITLSAAAWSHGPSMAERMRQQNIAWPVFKDSEMIDLMTFLNTRLVRRIAHAGKGAARDDAGGGNQAAASLNSRPGHRY
jgi:hypothetical protein